MSHKRRITVWVLSMTLLVTLIVPFAVSATESNQYGNAWVYDESQVLSPETEAYIAELNDTVFINYKNKPQLMVMVIDNLPYNMDDYKLDTFNQYGVGTKNENCGMLFILAINDREYGLEIGEGFTRGSILRRELENDVITDDMLNSLRAENYDGAVNQVVQVLATMMSDEENGVYIIKEAEYAEEQARLEAEAAARAEQFDIFAKKAIFSLLAVLAVGCVGCVIKHFWDSYQKDKLLDELFERNYRQMGLFGEQAAKVEARLRNLCKDKDKAWVSGYFGGHLYDHYVTFMAEELSNMSKNDNRTHIYIEAAKRRNNREAFENFQLVDLGNLICDVDAIEDDKEATIAENESRIETFLANNRHRILNKTIEPKLHLRFQGFLYPDRYVSTAEMERHFERTVRELSFEYEFKKFCAEYADIIKEKDFDQDEFYSELTATKQYAQYRQTNNYNNYWMHHHLMLHMRNQRLAREKREAEARLQAERRRRQAAQRSYAQQRSHNSSFGSRTGGGFSRGGGCSGRW